MSIIQVSAAVSMTSEDVLTAVAKYIEDMEGISLEASDLVLAKDGSIKVDLVQTGTDDDGNPVFGKAPDTKTTKPKTTRKRKTATKKAETSDDTADTVTTKQAVKEDTAPKEEVAAAAEPAVKKKEDTKSDETLVAEQSPAKKPTAAVNPFA